MADVIVVGSGASGVHFALSLLKKGHAVTMLDVGNSAPAVVNPDDSFADLKRNLDDPVEYFLGRDFESVVPPDSDEEVYGFSPNKLYIFDTPPGFAARAEGFEPLFSFAQGGLAQAWTGGCYPFNEADLGDFPLSFADLLPYYNEVSSRVGIIGADDDLAIFFPSHDHLLPPLNLDENSASLVRKYEERRELFNRSMGMFLGRSRIATLSLDRPGRSACDYSGRCMWGCPSDSLYVPTITLAECRGYERFTYVPNMLVSRFVCDRGNTINSVEAVDVKNGARRKWRVDKLVLAAGALSSAKIFLDSVYHQRGEIPVLTGLMDNRQILVPFVNLKMVGKRYDPETYQYHQLAVGFQEGDDYIHGQITTVKTALMQPAIQQIPLDLRTASFITRNFHAALGVININFSDSRRATNTVTLEPDAENRAGATGTVLKIVYSPPAGEEEKIKSVMKRVKKFFGRLGVVVPPGMAHVRPMGASVHYSGLLPMSVEKQPLTVSPACRSHDYDNLYLVDGISFPHLPAKNLTFTLMANAARVADLEFD
jgi:choline dehydrogenase-like flavoprotein